MLTIADARKRDKLSKSTNEIATFEPPKSDIIVKSQAWCGHKLRGIQTTYSGRQEAKGKR